VRGLGPLEQVVMDHLWDVDGPVTVRQVFEGVGRRRKLAYTTVMTVMNRLWRKKLLQRTRSGRAFAYRATHSREEYAAHLVREVLDGACRTNRSSSARSFLSIARTNPSSTLRRSCARSAGAQRRVEMRLALGVGALIAFLATPYAIRRRLLATKSPLVLGTFAALSLLGIAASTTAVLGIIVAPEPLPVTALGGVIDACVVGLTRLLSHPLRHWPSMLAAAILVALGARLVIAIVRTAKDTRRAIPSRHLIPGEADAGPPFGRAIQGVRVLPCAAPREAPQSFRRERRPPCRGLRRPTWPPSPAATRTRSQLQPLPGTRDRSTRRQQAGRSAEASAGIVASCSLPAIGSDHLSRRMVSSLR